jgi:signal transduction histidine kinase
MGAVELVRDRQYGPVTEFESELIRMVLDYLGVAVKNSQLRAQLLQAEKLRALGEMAAGVAHNFKNILTTILGHTQLLQEELASEGAVHASLLMIEKATRDAAQVVQRIQTFSKGRAAAACHLTDLPLLIKEVLEATRPMWKEQAERQGKPIETTFDPAPVPRVPCRAAELREVVTNLILNAIDAMPRGGNLAIRTYQSGRFACVAVSDTGTGMTGEVRRRIFNPFFTTKQGKGTGLGLSVSHALIKGHGGNIEVQSTPGQGTTFVVQLPMEAVAVQEEEE